MDHQQYEDWQSLYVAQRKSLIDYAARLTGSRDVAEDIVQEAFTICLSRQERDYQITRAFLFTIVRNLAHNRHRHHIVHQKIDQQDYPWWARYQAVDPPERQVIVIEKARIAAQAISELSPIIRMVVELYRFDGMTLQEIASRLEISVATAHRALKEGMEIVWEKMGFDE
ncbi:sigma-70 family RNA polymerase sigma factor [Agrobacterium vitis]|uniref:Sigma-70 family RNA polymerase sigma factor n=1 Tax=Agrobacterium vitis TaxID=373 RepID=A0AAE2RIY8_AGRVI|nr:sigma-70 family RNA polymerase sigma factor [Agrobacterium vitis]MBF2717690.1 sigma-70 family RNA polymerase sigma factor [Agrobacterium vitis]MVA22631.1 sigma-70 family RNA polymerase sigma factor [Agrobacterium vitis]